MTIRQWAQARTSTPVVGTNNTFRYGKRFDGPDALWELMKADPSFEVQGQWFPAASYGLLQIIPDTVRGALYGPGAYSTQDQQAIKLLYDPLTGNPVDKLFDPNVCTPLAALMDARASVKPELQPPLLTNESACSGDASNTFTQCSWDRLWKRRFRVFNSGDQSVGAGGAAYANEIVDALSQGYVPQP